jgi:hypothetical protein
MGVHDNDIALVEHLVAQHAREGSGTDGRQQGDGFAFHRLVELRGKAVGGIPVIQLEQGDLATAHTSGMVGLLDVGLDPLVDFNRIGHRDHREGSDLPERDVLRLDGRRDAKGQCNDGGPTLECGLRSHGCSVLLV